jgi:hypothetical protein
MQYRCLINVKLWFQLPAEPRDEFSVDYGKAYGSKQDVELQIQVDAVKAD